VTSHTVVHWKQTRQDSQNDRSADGIAYFASSDVLLLILADVLEVELTTI
jgi:hypothetical protein